MTHIVQKKGFPNRLSGIMIAYARILPGESIEKSDFPWDEAVHNNLLVVSGDFIGQSSLKDFLKKEFGAGASEGLESFAEHLREMGSELPEGLNPDELREKIESLSHMDIIPVPARIVQFDSEEQILEQSADVFWVGDFRGLAQAHLAVTSFPILYQAWYREQMSSYLQSDIEDLLNQIAKKSLAIESTSPEVLNLEGSLESFEGELLQLLNSEVVPKLMYAKNDTATFKMSMNNFKKFMEAYSRLEDIEGFEKALNLLAKGDDSQREAVELWCKLISAFHHERFEDIPSIQEKLNKFAS